MLCISPFTSVLESFKHLTSSIRNQLTPYYVVQLIFSFPNTEKREREREKEPFDLFYLIFSGLLYHRECRGPSMGC